MLFQFFIYIVIYELMNILRFIMVSLQILGALGLIIVGSSQFRKNRTINKSVVFIIVGVIVIIYLAINERIYFLISELSGEYISILSYALVYMIPNLISLITPILQMVR